MEVLEIIGKLSIGLLVIVVFFFILNTIMGAISKAFGTTSTLNGNVISSPEDFDNNIQFLKDSKKKLISNIKNIFVNKTQISSNPEETIKLLKQLDELKSKGALTDKEYDNLKNKLLNKLDFKA